MDTSCKLYFKRDNILQLRTSNSLVDYQLLCPPLKLFKMVEVNGAYEYDKCGTILLKSLRLMASVKVLLNRTNRWAGWANMTDYIDPYVNDMDPCYSRASKTDVKTRLVRLF